MEQSVFTLKDLNYYASFLNFALVEEDGSYYWRGFDEYTSSLLSKKYELPAHKASFSSLTESQWMNKLSEVMTYIVTNEWIW